MKIRGERFVRTISVLCKTNLESWINIEGNSTVIFWIYLKARIISPENDGGLGFQVSCDHSAFLPVRKAGVVTGFAESRRDRRFVFADRVRRIWLVKADPTAMNLGGMCFIRTAAI